MTKPPQISDAELLDLMSLGILVITDLETQDPILWMNGNPIAAELIEQRGRSRLEGSARWTWRIKYKSKRRRIVRAKLVWMFAKHEIITDDYRVHHGEGGRFDDGIGNLSKMTDDDHIEYHRVHRHKSLHQRSVTEDVPF